MTVSTTFFVTDDTKPTGTALGAGTLLAVEHGMHRRNKGPAGDEEHAANMARHHRRLKNSVAMKRVANRTARSWLSSDGL